MPYKRLSDLPDSVVSRLPRPAQELYMAVFNEAWGRLEGASERSIDQGRGALAHRAAWSAVKKEYEPKGGARWRRRTR